MSIPSGKPANKALWRIATALLIATLAAMSASCSDKEGRVDGPVLTSPRPALLGGRDLRMDAMVGGTVVFDESAGCLFLEGGYRSPVVWPHGASWQAEPPAVKLQGHLIEPGMTVRGGGGYLKHEHILNSAGTAVADAARACKTGPYGEIAFFNPGTEVYVIVE